MIFSLGKRMFKEVDRRLLWKFAYNLGWKGMVAVSRYKRRLKKGEPFPAFMMISVTDCCNLKCQGCWVTVKSKSDGMPVDTLNNIIKAAKRKGSYYFGLLGGEPLMYPHLLDTIEAHPDCYFQLFTNGTLLTDAIARRMRQLGNVTPLISVEGLKEVSDVRRGAREVYGRTMAGIEASKKNRLITGVAASICKSNFKDLVNEEFVNRCVQKGIHYLWFYIYRPVGARPTPELALSEEEILYLRRFMVDIRTTTPLIIIDTYWDENGKALCPGAIGLSHHINPAGDIEFCPPIQFACENVGNGENIQAIFENSHFLKEMRSRIADRTPGCILLEDPDYLYQVVEDLKAYDSSKRDTAYVELKRMTVCPGHHIPSNEIPEKSWFYKFAKKNAFFGLGAYG
ncbi:radical SAM protein [Marinilabiliaceae bacterium JC017]|nr:radical SAM protein [Marinilabiliaceae bacterium JC017]